MNQSDATPDKIGRIRPVTAPVRTQVADVLRQAIIDLVFKPGERLVERELCEQTGVSRTSLREGLRELEAEGLVRTIPYKGLVVAIVGLDEARHIYDVRSKLEGLLGSATAQKHTADDLTDLRGVFTAVRKATKAARFSDLIKLKTEFYAILMRVTANPVLTDILVKLHGRTAQFRATVMNSPGRADINLVEIENIINAIAARDAAAAEQACIEHVRNAGDIVIQLLEDADIGSA